jgi:preprotein translocase YajC subunit
MRGAFAADSPAKTATATGEDSTYQLSAEKMMTDNLFFIGVLFFIFYFILIRPQQKRLKLHQQLMKNLAKGDKVMTGGGIIGSIIKFEGDDIVVVEISPNVRVRVSRSSISEVLNNTAGLGETANDN